MEDPGRKTIRRSNYITKENENVESSKRGTEIRKTDTIQTHKKRNMNNTNLKRLQEPRHALL